MTSTADLAAVLAAHAARYPLMQPCDAVKLVYQNEFGGGHLVRDPEQSLRRLRLEYASVEHDARLPLYEDIGNGFSRVQLAAVDEKVYPLERLHADFVRAAAYRGSLDSFQQKLTALTHAADALFPAFTLGQLNAYLADYARMGFPPVSHSDSYRAAYRPAYRVLRP